MSNILSADLIFLQEVLQISLNQTIDNIKAENESRE
jgi:hypothetical protein